MSAQSERGEQSATCADRLLDNHVVISESRGNIRKSYVSSAQSGQIMGFRKITPHSQVCRNTIYLPPALLLKKCMAYFVRRARRRAVLRV